MKSSRIVAGVMGFSAARADDATAATSDAANTHAISLDFMTSPPSERAVDLAHLGAPRDPFSLQHIHHGKKHEREQRQDEQNDERKRRVEAVVRLQNEIAE